MASNTMNKNIFAAFGMDETEVAQVVIDKITGSADAPKETKNDAQETQNVDDGFKVVKLKESKPKRKSKTPEPKRETKATPKVAPEGNPLVLQLEDYPTLGTKITKAQTKAIAVHNKTTFEKVAEKKSAEEYLDPRSASFAAMADKANVAKSLTCTKACRLVTGPYTTPKEGAEPAFGCCTRENCSFAHSDAELQVPVCGFDGNCRFMYGKRDRKTRKIIPGTQCRFRHSSESVQEYYKRSKVQRPALPPTNEHSRKPRASRTSNDNAKTACTPGKYSSMPPPATKSPVTNHSRRTKSRWDEKPSPVDEKPSPVDEKPARKSRYRSYSSSDDSSSSESSSESEAEYRKRRSRERRRRSPVKRSRSTTKSSPAAQIIRVPTKELAAVAIKAAFDRGQYNVQVLVE